MTMNTTRNVEQIEVCPKCGSNMEWRRIKIFSDIRIILQCHACKFYDESSLD